MSEDPFRNSLYVFQISQLEFNNIILGTDQIRYLLVSLNFPIITA